MIKQLNKNMHRQRKQRRGEANIAAYILLTAIIVIGVIVGLMQIRNHLVQEYGDAAVGLDSLDQSFSYMVSVDGNSDGDFVDPEDYVLSAAYVDDSKYNVGNVPLEDNPGDAPAGITFTAPSAGEGS